MGYLNPIEVFGYQKFADKASSSGVDGVLVVDMPPEESEVKLGDSRFQNLLAGAQTQPQSGL